MILIYKFLIISSQKVKETMIPNSDKQKFCSLLDFTKQLPGLYMRQKMEGKYMLSIFEME